MVKQKTVFVGSLFTAITAMLFGVVMVAVNGLEPPDWLLRAEVAIFSLLALVCGFTACQPNVNAFLPWLRLRSVRGTVLIILGIAAMYVPAQLVASAVFLAIGIRWVWTAACDENDPQPKATGTELAEPAIDSVPLVEQPRRLGRVGREIVKREDSNPLPTLPASCHRTKQIGSVVLLLDEP